MAQKRVDLTSVFQAVTQTLAENQSALNQADEFNHDHGDNMLQTFQTITSALQEKQGKSASVALAHAAKKLERSSSSSSGKLYAQGLAQAATHFKGKKVDQRGAMDLLQTLIGGGQAPQAAGGELLGSLLGGMTGGQPSASQPAGQAGAGDLLGALLGGMTSDQPSASQPASQAGAGDLLGALLGGMTGGQPSASQPADQAGAGDLLGTLLGGMSGGQSSGSGTSNGLDMGDLLTAGMAFLQAKQSGVGTLQALVQAFTAASGMGRSPHRTQSTSLVVNSFLEALSPGGGSK